MRRTSKSAAALAAFALLAACGGDDGTGASPAEPSVVVTDGAETGDEPVTADETGTDDETDDGAGAVVGPGVDVGNGTDVAPSAEHDPGDVGFRVVNTLDRPVDVHVRTTGLVEAWLVDPGVEPGAVTEFHFPPEDGRLIVTEAGAGDATCVTGCDHFLAEASASFGEGDTRTVVLHDDEFSGPRVFDVWENPDPDGAPNANAMPAPDPAAGIVVPLAVALTDAQFGFQLSFDGIDGCQSPANDSGVLVGGNQTPPFTYAGDSVDVLLHDNQDRECVDDPQGGPFNVTGGPGTRTLLVLVGTRNAMDAIVIELAPGDATSPPAGDTEDDGGDDADASGGGSTSGPDADASALLAASVQAELGLDDDQAECTAQLFVDAVGADALLDDSGELVDPDTLPTADQDALVTALLSAIGLCGIEPAVLGD